MQLCYLPLIDRELINQESEINTSILINNLGLEIDLDNPQLHST